MRRNDNANNQRSGALQKVIIEAVGHRVLLLTAQFPFLFIGRVTDVIEDFIRLDVDTTQIDQLDQRVLYRNGRHAKNSQSEHVTEE